MRENEKTHSLAHTHTHSDTSTANKNKKPQKQNKTHCQKMNFSRFVDLSLVFCKTIGILLSEHLCVFVLMLVCARTL